MCILALSLGTYPNLETPEHLLVLKTFAGLTCELDFGADAT